jgi:diadenosine tetraphosphate (Ap4A) HIT family hydrolase
MKKGDDMNGDRSPSETDPECPFCDGQRLAAAIAARENVFAVDDLFPVTKGHLLIIPRRHAGLFHDDGGRESERLRPD